ncbi:hypothetical protein D9M71_714360 [compost metagenome]
MSQARALGLDFGLGEVTERHPEQWIHGDFFQRQGGAEDHLQNVQNRLDVGQAVLGLHVPDQVSIQGIGIEFAQGQIP